MTPEKDDELCAKYPKIFRDRYASPQTVCMCWGFECGDGWYDLIDTLCHEIQSHIDNKIRAQKYRLEKGEIGPNEVIPEEEFQVVASQVKSKFSGLRFYVEYNGLDDEIRGMISMAESMSYKICEECGNRGTLRKDSWITNYCDPCYTVYKNRLKSADSQL